MHKKVHKKTVTRFILLPGIFITYISYLVMKFGYLRLTDEMYDLAGEDHFGIEL